MNIQALSTVVAPKSQESSKAPQVFEGVSFAGAIVEAVKEGKISMPGGVQSGKLDFNKEKFVFDQGFSYMEEEEQKVKEFLDKISKILKDKREKNQ